MADVIAYNVNHTAYEKNCLIDYTTLPFLQEIAVETHQNHWQSKELARIVGDFGYNVDVRSYLQKDLRPDKTYDLIIDIHPDAPDAYRGLMNEGCKRVAYLTTSNPSFNNREEDRRLDDLQARRSFRLSARRIMDPLDACIAEYDGFCLIGNDFTLQTFRDEFTLPKHYFIRNNGYDFDFSFDASVKRADAFFFLGGPGQVHKGLDLLLDIFSERNDVYLFICSNTIAEADFDLLYQKNLYGRDNIMPLGFTDIHGDLFREAASICSYCVMPSCAEGCSGSVLTAMSAGLIPIVSKACGLDADEAIILPDCSLDTIEKTIDAYRAKDMGWIAAQSDYYRNIANTRFSRESYTASVVDALTDILGFAPSGA